MLLLIAVDGSSSIHFEFSKNCVSVKNHRKYNFDLLHSCLFSDTQCVSAYVQCFPASAFIKDINDAKISCSMRQVLFI